MATVHIHSGEIVKPIKAFDQQGHVWLQLGVGNHLHLPSVPGALEAAQAMALAYNRFAFPASVAAAQQDAA